MRVCVAGFGILQIGTDLSGIKQFEVFGSSDCVKISQRLILPPSSDFQLLEPFFTLKSLLILEVEHIRKPAQTCSNGILAQQRTSYRKHL